MMIKKAQLYIPSLAYPKKNKPLAKLPETRRYLESSAAYTHVETGGVGVNRVFPLVSTEFYHCQALIVTGGILSGVGLAHVVHGDLATDYLSSMKDQGMKKPTEATLVMCIFSQEMAAELMESCTQTGLRIKKVLEIPLNSDGQAAQTDLILHPTTQTLHIFSSEHPVQTIKL